MKKSKFKFFMMCGIIFLLIGGLITGATYRYGIDHYSEFSSTTTDFAQNFDADSVNILQINGVSASVFIEKGERFSIVAENIPEQLLKCEITNTTLEVSMSMNWGVNIGFLMLPNFPSAKDFMFMGIGPLSWNESAKIYIYIPEGKSFNEVRFSGNTGNIKADYIESDELRIYSNVGNVNIDKFKTEGLFTHGGTGNLTLAGTVIDYGSIDMDLGVGNAALKLLSPTNSSVIINGNVGNLSIDADIKDSDIKIYGGVGNVTWNGSASGDITIEGNVGNITLNLNGNIDDYNIHSEGGLGNTRINGVKYNIGEEYNKNTVGAVSNINIECGVGSIRLNIE